MKCTREETCDHAKVKRVKCGKYHWVCQRCLIEFVPATCEIIKDTLEIIRQSSYCDELRAIIEEK